MTAPLAFVDIETTGLDPDRHEVWEVALILRGHPDFTQGDMETTWQLPVDLGKADAKALDVGRYYERCNLAPIDYGGAPNRPEAAIFATRFAELTHGAHLVGANPAFDQAFLTRLLRQNGACPGWHYHLVDVEALMVGFLAGQGHRHADKAGCQQAIPWKSSDLAVAVGIDGDAYDKHTALGDARWARDIYDRIMGTPA